MEAHICFDGRPLVHGIIFLLFRTVGAAPRTTKRHQKPTKREHSKYSKLLTPERKTETCNKRDDLSMMKPKNRLQNSSGFPSPNFIVLQVVAFLRIHESGHKIWPKDKGANCSCIFFEFTTWALCHANPLKKPKLPKRPPETNQKFPKKFSPLSLFLLLNHLIWIQFFCNFYSKINGKILKFNSSFSASALAFFAASKASVSALRFVPWRFGKEGLKTRLNH